MFALIDTLTEIEIDVFETYAQAKKAMFDAYLRDKKMGEFYPGLYDVMEVA